MMLYALGFYFSLELQGDWILESVLLSILHTCGFFVCIFAAPYFSLFFKTKNSDSISYSNYFSGVSWVLLMSVIVGISLLVLGFIAIRSIITLFDISSLIDEGKWFLYWAVISIIFSAPLYALASFPRIHDVRQDDFDKNRFFSFLIKYIAIPFIALYFVILYAYTIRVFLDFTNWPKGIISWMVIGFTTFGYITYVSSRPYE